MVGMPVGNHGSFDRPPGIDVKVPRRAIKAIRIHDQKRVAQWCRPFSRFACVSQCYGHFCPRIKGGGISFPRVTVHENLRFLLDFYWATPQKSKQRFS